MRKIVLLSLISASIALYGEERPYAETTSQVAQRLGLYHLLTELRNKANDFLSFVEERRDARIAFLKYKHRFNEAQEKELELRQELAHLNREIDSRFERLDRLLVLGGAHLDKIGAHIKTKEALVKAAHERAQALIGSYIKAYHGQHSHR